MPPSGRTTESIAHRAFALFALTVALLLAPATGVAHDIPNDVRVLAFVKPEGRQLRLLMRVPMAAMREVDVPLRGPGYLDLEQADGALRNAVSLWLLDNIDVWEGDVRLPRPRIADVRVSLASDRSFGSYASALSHMSDPRLARDVDLYWNQQLLDVLLEYPIASDQSKFSIHPRLARLGLQVVTVLRFLPPGGAERAFELRGDPGVVRLDPSWHQAVLRFVESGIRHILDGTDHLLFIACLVIPFRRLRPLLIIATAFTVAHSITLIASAFGFGPQGLWFPPLVETLIAASIVYMALENIFGSNLRRRWIAAFVFGLVHGFGFAFALRETLQFAGAHLVSSLLAFNVGVEIGQVAVLLVLVPLLGFVFRFVPERLGTIVLSVLVAHTGWHWMLERGEQWRQFPLPTLDAAAAASLLRWLMAAAVLAGLLWVIDAQITRRTGRGGVPQDDARAQGHAR
jgi:HupE / UreJ protein